MRCGRNGPCATGESTTFFAPQLSETPSLAPSKARYICPAGKVLTTTGKVATDGETLYYRARTRETDKTLVHEGAEFCECRRVRELCLNRSALTQITPTLCPYGVSALR
jgi:hypothetical protein